MTKRNEKSVNFHESLTLRRNWKRWASLNHCNFKRITQDQNQQSQNHDDDAKSVEMQRQKCSKKRDQREKRVKNSEELVQFVRFKNVKRFLDQVLNHHFHQQSKCHELRLTIQNNNTEHSRNDHQHVD